MKIGNLPEFFLFLATAAILFSVSPAAAVVKPGAGAILRETYQRNIINLEASSFGLPLFLNSFEKNDRVHVAKEQLFEQDKQDSLTFKPSEHKKQLALQRQLGPAL